MKNLICKYPFIAGVLLVLIEWYAIVFLLLPWFMGPELVATLDGQLFLHTLSVMGIGIVPIMGFVGGVMIEDWFKSKTKTKCTGHCCCTDHDS